MAQLSEWLQIMLGEIARKQEDVERAHEEEVKRSVEKVGNSAASHADAVSPAKAAGGVAQR
jgi:hypothetical protein